MSDIDNKTRRCRHRTITIDVNSLNAVCGWISGDDVYPAIKECRDAMIAEVLDWYVQKSSGMDIVASSVLDELCEIIKAMRDR